MLNEFIVRKLCVHLKKWYNLILLINVGQGMINTTAVEKIIVFYRSIAVYYFLKCINYWSFSGNVLKILNNSKLMDKCPYPRIITL